MATAPEGFLEALPDQPPTVDEIHLLVEEWENVERINDLRWEERAQQRVCEYMIFNTDDGRGFRVIWEDGDWFISERRGTY